MRYVQFVNDPNLAIGIASCVADIDDDDMPGGRPATLADVPSRPGEAVYEINRDTPPLAAGCIHDVKAGMCGGSGVPVRGNAL